MSSDPRASGCPTPGGILAGAVLRAVRRSARATSGSLAAALDLSEDTYLSIEAGILQLAEVPVPMLEKLALVLKNAGAKHELVADLDVAAWADLVLSAIAANEDATCLLADPITNDGRFAELMTWALTGQLPLRYRPYAMRAPLVRDAVLIQRVTNLLQADRYGPGMPMPRVLTGA